MGNIIRPGVDAKAFLQSAKATGYSMQEGLIGAGTCGAVSRELDEAGYLFDLTEQVPTEYLSLHRTMPATKLLHRILEGIVSEIEDDNRRHFPLFSVRVFEAGDYATTIHRNDPAIGPWAVGITLKGNSQFHVYSQNVLPWSQAQTIPLRGDGNDPLPIAEMDAGAGSAWTLYTENEQRPHSGGLVTSEEQRELIIFYGFSLLNW